MRSIAFLLALATACVPPDADGSNNGSKPGNPPVTKAPTTVSGISSFDGIEIPCDLVIDAQVIGPADGSKHELVADGQEHIFTVGNPEDVSHDGLPTHTDNGVRMVTVPRRQTLDPGSEVAMEFSLNFYLAPASFACDKHVYEYDSESPTKKATDDPWKIFPEVINDEFRVEGGSTLAFDGPYMFDGGDDTIFGVQGDQVVFVTHDDDMFMLKSNIDEDDMFISYAYPSTGFVSEYICHRQ